MDPGRLPVFETHTYPPQPSSNPPGCRTDGRAGMYGHVFTAIKLWLQVRVGTGLTYNLGILIINSPHPFLTHDQSAIVGLLGKRYF